jgi:hypothetical protein
MRNMQLKDPNIIAMKTAISDAIDKEPKLTGREFFLKLRMMEDVVWALMQDLDDYEIRTSVSTRIYNATCKSLNSQERSSLSDECVKAVFACREAFRAKEKEVEKEGNE